MLKVTHLQRFSVHDGPGIRTTVFCKGCSLRCFWCHNPEAIEAEIRLWHDKKQCISCGSCRRGCLKGLFYGEEGCDCNERTGFPCAETCPSEALSPTGRWMEQDALMEQLLSDSSHYRRTGGGITFSGGEPLLQAEALQQIMASDAMAGISRAVDTAGNVRWDDFCTVLNCTDIFLFDIKCMDSALHKKGTGVDNGRIQENLERLCHTGKKIWIRIPVIPGWNDVSLEMAAIARRIRELSAIPQCSIERIQLLPFHRFGREKYARLGWENPAEELLPPSEKKMEGFLSLFQEMGLSMAEVGNHTVLSGDK